MDYDVSAQLNQARLSSQVAQLREEIKMRVANKASAEGTFDKVIECFVALTTLAKETRIEPKGIVDWQWRRKRNEALDVLLELVHAVEPSKPLRAQMVTKGREWMSEFNDHDLLRDVMAYCYIKRFRPELVHCRHNTLQFSDEELEKFAHERPEALNHAYVHGMSPGHGALLQYPLDREGATDHWEYMHKFLEITTHENDATWRPDQLPGGPA